ncbi:MAG: hypothetical protein LBE22_08390 [Azoarcus sp.]|nr:hypothetical protein [Azoarcus sp.]
MPQNGGWKGTWSSPDGRESQAITLTENITRTENNSGIRPFPYEIRIVASEDPGEHDDSDDCSNAPLVSEIRLYQEDRLVQTLPSSSEEGPCGMFLPETVDINFDGYPDLRQGLFVATNIPYSYWLYDPDTQKMVDLEEGIEGGESTVFDPVHKTIVVDWRSGCCSHGVNIYAWQGKNPVKVDSAESYYQAEMINGKLTSCYITPSYQNGRIEYPGAVYQEGDVFRFMSREGWSCIDDYILSHTRIHIWQSDQPPPEKLKLLRTEEVRWNKTMTNDGKTVYCPEIPVFNNGKIERWLLKDECTNTPMGDGE